MDWTDIVHYVDFCDYCHPEPPGCIDCLPPIAELGEALPMPDIYKAVNSTLFEIISLEENAVNSGSLNKLKDQLSYTLNIFKK